MVSLILAGKILSLFLILIMGWLLVRLGLVQSEDSKKLSIISLYLVSPCINLVSFQVNDTGDVGRGLILAFAAALVIQVFQVAAIHILGLVIPLDPVEKTSAIYSNAGNMVIPIVASVLGQEYVIYTMAYLSVQQFLLWSHCKMTICGDRKIEFRNIFFNINMIAIWLGLVTFLLQIKFPSFFRDGLQSMGDMMGPLSMLVTGMLVGGTELRKVFTCRRVWMVAGIRLLGLPLLGLLLLKCGRAALTVPAGEAVLMIILLAAAAPSAATVTQMAQVYGKDADYASACNIVTTLLCMVTMPVIMGLY